jgi:hypothetical protein
VEVIILAIITMIISAFSKKKNAGDGDGKSKPFMAKPLDQQSKKRMEDYAKEVFGDVQKQFSGRMQEPQAKPETNNRVKHVQDSDTSTRKQVNEIQQATSRPGRLSVHQPVGERKQKPIEKKSLVPSTKNELVQAIIFSEILAPPKSKR